MRKLTSLSSYRQRSWMGAVSCLIVTLAPLLGCEATRVALETQQRANDIQQTIFDQQQEALRIYQFRTLAARLALKPAQQQDLNAAWNERDVLEFWAVMHERSKALRLVGVDARLWASEPIVALLGKQIRTTFQRASAATSQPAADGESDPAPAAK
ncbi:MAG TPA: hypothetical protein PLQ87_06870 [Phycisphaerae bacterium]|nr:hypothetical protein [Phycisphaerae bacterium]